MKGANGKVVVVVVVVEGRRRSRKRRRRERRKRNSRKLFKITCKWKINSCFVTFYINF